MDPPSFGAPVEYASRPGRLRLEHASSIDELSAEEWDACLGDRGAFTAAGLRFLERLFGPHQPPENHWTFHYYRVVDEGGRTVLATFFTEALWKDDMFAPAEVSAAAEARRRTDPYHATSTVFAMGSLLTEGNHLFLRRDGYWGRALEILLEDVQKRARACGAKGIVLRDLPAPDVELTTCLADQRFTSLPMPVAMVLELHHQWETENEFLASRSRKRRSEIRKKIFRWSPHYRARILAVGQELPSSEELSGLQELYRAVADRSLSMNTFPLPPETFDEMVRDACWELLVLDLRPDLGDDRFPVSFVACFVGDKHYVPTVIGLDYRYVVTHAAYRQSIWRIIVRANELGKSSVHFGLGAPVEKARFGCSARQSVMFHAEISPC